MKARRLGLCSAEDLRSLAVKRGCLYYDVDGRSDRLQEERGRPIACEDFSNAELAVALLALFPPGDLLRQRMAAAMLSAPDVSASELAALAIQENCAPMVRHIADCGHAIEPGHPFWHELRGLLDGVSFDIHAMPHPTRFIEMTGITRGKIGIQKHWVRPATLKRSAG